MVGVEALIRWQDPERGLVTPAEFLPVLESTGLILRVGEWVLRQAAEDCRRWRHFELPPVRVSVNVSTAELSQPGLAARFLRFAGTRNGSGIDLDVEITEGELLHDSASVTEALQQLRAAGVRVAIDDFGTGFSSLSRLSELPIDILKIAHPTPSSRRSSRSPARTISILSPKEWRPRPNWKFSQRWAAKYLRDICTAPRSPHKQSRRCCVLVHMRPPKGKANEHSS
jgi:EAL domain-containing protein (putative c-di-GMP-specific phosphodiesterase class I)